MSTRLFVVYLFLVSAIPGHDVIHAQGCGEWKMIQTSGPSPSTRLGFSMAYDSFRRVTVVVGGQSNPSQTGPTLPETWELVGNKWERKADCPALWVSAMAYDPVRKVMVLHGGEREVRRGATTNDVWLYDGSSWTLSPIPGPGARNRHAMVFDEARSVMVLYGGHLDGPHFDDTWVWDGVGNWQRITPQGQGPGPRRNHTMVYDRARQKVVLFGGYDYCCGTLGDTWEWDGVSWRQVSTSGPLRRATVGAYDDQRQKVVIFGGFHQPLPEACCGNALNDTWEWDGVTWTLCPIMGPSAQNDYGLAYDISQTRLVAFGGVNGETWERITNRPPNCSQASLSINRCWPPNHRFRQVEVEGLSDPDGDALLVTITGISADEPVDAEGSGNTCPDAVLVDRDGDGNPESAGLRCERSGKGNGRVYTIHFVVMDDKGAQCTSSLTFCVSHDDSPDSTCIDDGQIHDATICPKGGDGARVFSVEELEVVEPHPLFLRGDLNWDESLDISDAVGILGHLFIDQAPLVCPDAADFNDDGEVDISDPIAILGFLYLGTFTPTISAGSIGSDLTPDSLGCQ